MPKSLPLTADLRFFEQARSLQGSIAIKQLPRLSEQVIDTQGEIEVSMLFAVNDQIAQQRIKTIQLQLDGEFKITCQRCLEPMVFGVARQVEIAVGESEAEIADLPEHLEAYMAEDGLITLADLIDQELILSLPIIAKHPLEQCPAREWVQNDATDAVPEAKQNPFSVLKDLKQ